MYNYYHNKNILLLKYSLLDTFLYISLKLLYMLFILLYHYNSFPISILYVYLSRVYFLGYFLHTQISHNN